MGTEPHDKQKKILLAAAVKYAKVAGVPLTKVAWALATILKRPDNTVYHELKALEGELDFGQDLSAFQHELQPEIEEDMDSNDSLESRVGEIVLVKAVSVRSYGVVCTLDGATRTLLLHISEVANEFIEDLNDYVRPGDRFEAMLVSNDKGRLGLSTKRVKPLEQKYSKYLNNDGESVTPSDEDVKSKYKNFYSQKSAEDEEVDFR